MRSPLLLDERYALAATVWPLKVRTPGGRLAACADVADIACGVTLGHLHKRDVAHVRELLAKRKEARRG